MITFRPPRFSAMTLSAGLVVAACAAQQAGAWQPAAQPGPPPADAGQAAADDPFSAQEDQFLLREPETPAEFLRATLQAQSLGRPNLARLYLQRFLELNPDDETLLALRDEHGPAAFSRLANQPELQPLSTQLADRINEVFRRRGASPERVDALLDALSETADKAFPAREALVNAGETVVPQVLVRLQEERDDFVRKQLLDVLAAMGDQALPALHAALDAPSDALRVQIASVLGRIGSRDSIPHLYFPAYGPEQPVAVRSAARQALVDIAKLARVAAEVTDPVDVAARLDEEAVAALAGPAPSSTPSPDAAAPAAAVRVWSWDNQARTVRSMDLDPRSASLFQGTRFARQAFLIAPQRADAQSLYLAFLLGSEATQAGTYEPPSGPGTAFDLALAAGPETAQRVLRQAMQHNIPRAAIGALGVVSRTASPAILLASNPVTEALNHPDPRVQLAAAITVLRLNPEKSFPLAGRVVEILSRALSGDVVPTAVIIDPNVQRGSTMAGFTRQMGFDALYARTGQEGFLAAAERATPAFILVNLNVSRWPLSQTLANLRADARTQGIPVIVYGPPEGEWRVPPGDSGVYTYFRGPRPNDPTLAVTRTLAEVPGTAYIVETTTQAAFMMQMRPALAAMQAEPLSPAELSESRAVAAFWLAQIADMQRQDIFPLKNAEPALVGAIADPALVGNALVALSAIPTATAQRAIAGIVLAPATNSGLQTNAAGTLADHARRYGLLIDDETVASLNSLWASTADAELRSALSSWGGSLRPGSAVARQRLEAVPPPTLPAPAP